MMDNLKSKNKLFLSEIFHEIQEEPHDLGKQLLQEKKRLSFNFLFWVFRFQFLHRRYPDLTSFTLQMVQIRCQF